MKRNTFKNLSMIFIKSPIAIIISARCTLFFSRKVLGSKPVWASVKLWFLMTPSMHNVVVACKIWSFLCSLDNLLQKNVIVFFFGNQISKWRSFEKKGPFFDLLFTFFSHQGKVTQIPSAHCLTHIHTYILLTLLTYFALLILKKKYEFIRYGFSLVWFLVLILIRAILEQSINNKMVSKI